MTLENFDYEREYHCPKCGVEMKADMVYKRLVRGSDKSNCPSCEARPLEQVRYGSEVCKPWHGDFDDYDNPMKDGEPYRPGARTCGHSDCVNQRHILSTETLLAEQHSISYRTGNRLTFDQLLTQLKKEQTAA